MFKNPYSSLEDKDLTRTTIRLSNAHRAAVARVYPRSGAMQTTINILWEKLVHELERRKITSYAPELYELALNGASIVLGVSDEQIRVGTGCTVAGPSQVPVNPKPVETPKGNDGRGTEQVARVPEGTNKSPDSSQRPKGNRRAARKTAKTTKG